MKILVTGGSGLIGRSVIRFLIEDDHVVRMFSRNAERDAKEWPRNVEPHPGSITDPDALGRAVEECDAVLHIVGIAREDPPEITFEAVNVGGTRNVVTACDRAHCGRIVYVSSLGAARGSSDYHRSKAEAEDVLRGYFGSWLICRPGNVYGPGDEVISRYLKMVRTLPAVPVLGDGNQPFQPIWVDDLGRALAAAVTSNEPSQTAVDLAGPEPTTTNEVLDILEDITGNSPARISIPEWVARHGARAAETLGLDLPFSEDQVTMLLEQNFVMPEESNALTDVFGIEPIRLEEGLVRLAETLPEQPPRSGEGTLHRSRYWADIRGTPMSADELFEMVRQEFYDLPPEGLLEVGVEPGGARVPEEGSTLTMAIPLRGTIQVRVAEIADNTITFATIDGHFLSGVIRFMVEERSEEDAIRFEIRSYARPTDTADRIAMGTVGRAAQKLTWKSVVEEVVKRSGGTAEEGVQDERTALRGDDARRVEEWADGMIQRMRRRNHREQEEES